MNPDEILTGELLDDYMDMLSDLGMSELLDNIDPNFNPTEEND